MVTTSKETVVVDDRLTTSRGPSTALAFAYELVEQLGGTRVYEQECSIEMSLVKIGKTGVILSFFMWKNSGKSSLFS